MLSRSVAATRVAVRRALLELAPTAAGGRAAGPTPGDGPPAGASPSGTVPAGASPGELPVAEPRSDGQLPAGGLVLVACSGGADSLALASATVFVASRLGLRAGLITVDHGLQAGSAARAADVAAWAAGAGFDPVDVVRVEVGGRPGGPEAAARDARYEALARIARERDAAAVLLGHTRDDQAETVLLALARGSGPRGLAGMPYRRVVHGVPFLRPLLTVPRAETRAACLELGLAPWQDPHNSDPAFARARVRAALPILVDTLGPDVVDNLARTATLLAADVAVLDELAEQARDSASEPDGALRVSDLAALRPAIRGRVLREFALASGAPAGALALRHITALDALVTSWHGQGPVGLPGGMQVARVSGVLRTVAPR